MLMFALAIAALILAIIGVAKNSVIFTGVGVICLALLPLLGRLL